MNTTVARLDSLISKMGTLTEDVGNLFPKVDTFLTADDGAVERIVSDIHYVADQAKLLSDLESRVGNLLIIISAVMALVAGLVIVVVYDKLKVAFGT